MNENFDFTVADNPIAETAFLCLLLQKKGLKYSDAKRAIDTYEIPRRLTDDHERILLLDYGFENIAADIYNKMPIGNQWLEYEETLFNVKERALSRSRYHILAQALQQRQTNEPLDDIDTSY